MRPWTGLLAALILGIASAQPEPPVVTATQAMRQAARQLPSVQAARALWESATGYANSIGSQPNPFLRLAATAGEAPEEANALVFRFEVAGQPGLRENAALAEAQARQRELAHERRRVALLTGQAYYTYWEKQEALTCVNSRVELARNLEQSARRRYKVGEISQNSQLRAQLELARAQADQAQAQAEYELAQGLLNLLVGQPAGTPVPLPRAAGELPVAPEVPVKLPSPDSPDQLEQLPELQALKQELEARQQQAELARRGNAPELQLQFYQSRFWQTRVQGAQLLLNIPLWDWGQVEAEVQRREGLARAAEAQVAERHLQLRQRLLEAWKRYQSAQGRKTLLAGQAGRFSRLANDARRAYDANLMTLLEVFDVQHSFSLALQSYINAEAETARASLELGALAQDGFFLEVSREP